MRFLIILGVLFLSTLGSPLFAQTQLPTVLWGCQYSTVLPTLANGQHSLIQCDSAGQLITAGSSGSAGAGNVSVQEPTSIPGCTYNSSAPTLTSGQTVGLQCDSSGRIK